MNVTHTRPDPTELLTPQEYSFLDRQVRNTGRYAVFTANLKQHKDAKLMGKLQQLAGRS